MPSNRRKFRSVAVIALMVAASSAAAAPLVYEGQLSDAGRPANGRYDLRLTPHRAATGIVPLAATITFEDVPVVDGKFRVEGDFGAMPTTGAQPWMQVEVRDGATQGAFAAIQGREQAKLATLIGQCWSTTGDAGSDPATHFLGTTDAQPLVLRVQNQQVVRYEPSTTLFGGLPNTANVIAGSGANRVNAGVRGATVAGGGTPADPVLPSGGPNEVHDIYGTVGGGYDNSAGTNDAGATNAHAATVAGGSHNSAGSFAGTVAGGSGNRVEGIFGTIGGGSTNAAHKQGSTIGGGEGNIAAGVGSTVSGGSTNCAGGAYSWAGGSRAKIRYDNAVGSTCGGAFAVTSGDANGDEGTFAWADDSNRNFVSTGADQFLVRSTGGMVLQPVIGVETDARKPRAQFNVITGSSGLNPDVDLRANYIAVFEQSTHNLITLLSPSTFERGVIFGDETSPAVAGVLYNGTTMQFRVGANQTRMTLGTSGDLTLNSANASKIGGGAWSLPSDARLKSNVRDLDGALERLLRLRGISYEYTNPDAGMHPRGTQIGFVAQEVQKVFPDWVGRTSDGYLTVGVRGFEALSVEALRELATARELDEERNAAAIGELQRRNESLAMQNAMMRAEQERLEAQLARMAHRLDRLEESGRTAR